jgi:hypothetical protein
MTKKKLRRTKDHRNISMFLVHNLEHRVSSNDLRSLTKMSWTPWWSKNLWKKFIWENLDQRVRHGSIETNAQQGISVCASLVFFCFSFWIVVEDRKINSTEKNGWNGRMRHHFSQKTTWLKEEHSVVLLCSLFSKEGTTKIWQVLTVVVG